MSAKMSVMMNMMAVLIAVIHGFTMNNDSAKNPNPIPAVTILS